MDQRLLPYLVEHRSSDPSPRMFCSRQRQDMSFRSSLDLCQHLHGPSGLVLYAQYILALMAYFSASLPTSGHTRRVAALTTNADALPPSFTGMAALVSNQYVMTLQPCRAMARQPFRWVERRGQDEEGLLSLPVFGR